jgi:hypothetical protein
MPVALDVDWSHVRTLACAVGLKVAAARLGLPYDAVRQRSSREEWFANIPRNQVLPPTVKKPVTLVTTPAEALVQELKDLGSKSRVSLARGLAKAAHSVEVMDGNEILERAGDVKSTAQSLALVHAWSANSPVVKVALNVTGEAQVSVTSEQPTLDAEWCDAGEAEPTQTVDTWTNALDDAAFQ